MRAETESAAIRIRRAASFAPGFPSSLAETYAAPRSRALPRLPNRYARCDTPLRASAAWRGGRPRCWSAAWVMCLLACCCLCRTARAAFAPEDRGWEGSSDLIALARSQLGDARVRPVSSLDYSVLEPRDAILFLHPEVEIRFHALAAFLGAGGRAAVVDDYGKAAPLLERFHIHRANAPARPALQLQGNPALPIALPAPSDASENEPSDHVTLRGVDQLVTNHPTALRLETGIELTRLLVLPARGEAEALLAVTGVIGDAKACGLTAGVPADRQPLGHCGRLLAMGDPSSFINLMLRYPGNRNFARGVVSYLVEDDTWGRRGGNLYVLNGSFRQSGSYGDAEGWRESLAERQSALLDWLEEVRTHGLPEPMSIALAAVAAIGVCIWTALTGGQLYVPLAPGYARPVPVSAQGGFAGRFAVLSAPSTDRALVLLELKQTLEASLRQRLSLPGASSASLAEIAAQRRVLRPDSARSLELLLRRLGAAELALVSARRLNVSDRALRGLHEGALALLAEIERPRGGPA
jgi:hypothetical protein